MDNIDKNVLRSYLLGTLNGERKAELEETILFDRDSYEELSLIEEELIDQYVAGGLSKKEQQLFETNFLVTAERQQNLRFGQLFRRYLNSQKVSQSQPVNRSAPARRFFSPSPIAFAMVVVVVLALGLLSWFASRKPVEQHVVQQDSSAVVVVALAPGSVESRSVTAQHVTVPPQGVDVKLELEIKNTRFRNYKSELFREDKSLQTDKLSMETKGQHHIVPLTITGQMLSPGDYQVKLSGVLDSGQDEFIDNYTFRVTK